MTCREPSSSELCRDGADALVSKTGPSCASTICATQPATGDRPKAEPVICSQLRAAAMPPSDTAASIAKASRATLEQRQKAHIEYLQRMQAAVQAKTAEREAASKQFVRQRHLLRDRVLKRHTSCPPALPDAASSAGLTHLSDPGGAGALASKAEGAPAQISNAIGALASLTPAPSRALTNVRASRVSSVTSFGDYLSWRKRLRIPEGTKVFCMAGSGRHSDDTRRGLLRRGWLENPDGSSPFFDLKWAVRSCDIDHGALLPGQIVNHFVMGTRLTTKVGLMQCLRDAPWSVSADADTFFPRSYDLCQAGDKAALLKDMRLTAACSLLKRALACGSPDPVGVAAFAAALKALRHHLRQFGYLRVESSKDGSCQSGGPSDDADIDEVSWSLITGHPLLQSPQPPCISHYAVDQALALITRDVRSAPSTSKGASGSWLPRARGLKHKSATSPASDADPPPTLPAASALSNLLEHLQQSSCVVGEFARNKELLALQRQEQRQEDLPAGGDVSDSGRLAQAGEGAKAESLSGEPADHDADTSASMAEECVLSRLLSGAGEAAAKSSMGGDDVSPLDCARRLLAELKRVHPQLHIDGMSNLWIVKPAGKSRGRGIEIYNDIDKLLEYVKQEQQWIVQKYIERPLIIYARKFDIRQWVLVSSWNPLVAWFYQDCYLRFAADHYDTTDHNIYSHLCNNSISKHANSPVQDEITSCGNMWSVARFRAWLLSEFGSDRMWSERIEPGMKNAVICSLLSSQQSVKQRDATCQIYGFDFLVDEHFQVWLLEVNSSPTMEYSTAITQKLCAEVQEDTLKVIIDLPQTIAKRGAGNVDVDAEPTGAWERILAIPEVSSPLFTGISLLLEGKCVLKSTRQPPAVNTVPRVYESHIARQTQQRAAQQAAEADAAKSQLSKSQDVDSLAGNALAARKPPRQSDADLSSCRGRVALLPMQASLGSAAPTSEHGGEPLTLYSTRSSGVSDCASPHLVHSRASSDSLRARSDTPYSSEDTNMVSSTMDGSSSGQEDVREAAIASSRHGGWSGLAHSKDGADDAGKGLLPQLHGNKQAAAGRRAMADRKRVAAEQSWYQRKSDGGRNGRPGKTVPLKILSLAPGSMELVVT